MCVVVGFYLNRNRLSFEQFSIGVSGNIASHIPSVQLVVFLWWFVSFFFVGVYVWEGDVVIALFVRVGVTRFCFF